MNILEVYGSFDPNKGGVQRHIYELCKYLIQRGHRPIILDWQNMTPSFKTSEGIIIQRFSMKPSVSDYLVIPYLSERVWFFAKRFNIDVIHAHGHLAGFASAVAGLFLRKPVVMTIHLPIKRPERIPFHIPPFKFLLDMLIFHFVSSIICVSKFTLNETVKLGFPRSKMRVIYNWITHASRISDPGILLDLGLADKRFILSVGRIDDRQKNFLGLIRVMKTLIGRGLRIHLVIVGDGPDRSRLIRYAEEIGVEEMVHLIGYVSDTQLAHLYRSCEAFVLPSRFEGLPIVLLEAMSYGRPIIATDVGGIPEVIENGKNGILIDPSLGSLASELSRLLANGELRRNLGEASRSIIDRKFSVKNCCDTIRILEKSCRCRR